MGVVGTPLLRLLQNTIFLPSGSCYTMVICIYYRISTGRAGADNYHHLNE